MSVAVAGDDPLQSTAVAFAAGFVNDPWVVRRLPAMV
jgi:hypothetical protein